MRIATWNVNSLKARLPRVEEWIGYAAPDVLCLQETKMADAAFPVMSFSALGYEVAHHGNGRWNGVAIASRVGLADVTLGFGHEREPEEVESRLISATCGDVRLSSVYVPNGRAVGTEHFTAKLGWLGDLKRHIAESCAPDGKVVVCGDFNVAPDDRDVWNPARANGGTHVTRQERDAIRELEHWGLFDVFRQQHPEPGLFSWWDYRAGDFHNRRGMRIDLLLATRALAERTTFALIDRNARKGKLPSDHAPLFVDFDLERP